MLPLSVGLALAAPVLVDRAAAEALVDGGATVLDTRGWLAYRSGHIPGAQRVDWRIGVVGGSLSGRLGDPDAVAADLAALGVDAARPVLVVGEWADGWGEEGRIFWDLEYLGHSDAHVLRGGMTSWTRPTQLLRDTPTPGAFPARVRPELRVGRAELTDGRKVLDVRDPAEFAGSTPYGEAWGGHVPGATNAPWRQLLAGPPPVSPGERVAVYCTGGVRSGLAYAILRDAGVDVANYDGGWWEWAREVPGP